jgi:ferric-dicitrate binding protein FerR (iron transport regulator)
MTTMEDKYELAKWLAGEMTEQELTSFQNDPDYATYVKIAEYSSQLKAPDFDEELIYQNTINLKKTNPKVISFTKSNWLKIAAIFLVLLGLTFFIRSNATSTQLAENGKKVHFLLPDRSDIVLNSGSEINYKKWNWENNRNLDLKGEAYFKVAHGKKFKVNTSLGTVTVLGTQFNVKVRNNRFDVTCYQGRVKVVHNNQIVIITKGNEVTFVADTIEKSTVKSTKPEWTSNQISFKQEKLHNILDEIQRQFDCKIVFNAKENSQLFTGTLPANDLKSALEIVSATYHLKISKFDSKKIVLEDF